jgi:hypothetical protein
MSAEGSYRNSARCLVVGAGVEGIVPRLSREFLQAVSGAERLAWPPAEGTGPRKSGQGKKAERSVGKRRLTSERNGEPSLAVFRAEG